MEHRDENNIIEPAKNDIDLYNHCIGHTIGVDVNNHNVKGEHESFRAAILDGAPVLMTGREGAKTVAVCCAVVKSAKTGQAVAVDYDAIEG